MAATEPSTDSSRIPPIFHPGTSFVCPKRSFGSGANIVKRSFRSNWCEEFSWLHYDIRLDAAFCHVCMTASHGKKLMASTRRDPAFIKNGHTYWKEATTAFRKHQSSECHREAVKAVVLPRQTRDIAEAFSEETRKQREVNRKVFVRILENLRFLARQGLALRGSGGDQESNFTQLLLLRATDVPLIAEWMKKESCKYTSHDIQNECLKIMALRILRDVSKRIQKSACFAVMADECTDISNKEQFTICIRWVTDALEVQEDFIGLYSVDRIDAETLFRVIKDTLLRLNVSLCRCRGQCYDGASSMSGSKTGVATRLIEEERRAVFVHCFGHALNLAVGDTLKRSTVCKSSLENAYEITKLVKFSPKRNSMFDRIKADVREKDHAEGTGIRSFCPTRWTVRADSIVSILKNYEVLKKLWDECLESKLVPEVKGRIIGVKAQMSTYDMLFGLKLSEKILKLTDNLSKTLQKQTLSAAEGHSVAKMTIKTLKALRTNEHFAAFFENTECLRCATGTLNPVLPRKRKAPERFEIGSGEGYHSLSIEEHYRRQYFEAVDLTVSSIQARFDQPGFRVYQNLENLLLKACRGEDYSSELMETTEFYGADLDKEELSAQLEILQCNFAVDGKSPDEVMINDILTYLRNLSPNEKNFLRQICTVSSLLLVLPATNATSERSFSTMRRIKSYLRNSTGQERLNHLMTLSTYKEELDKLNLLEVANEFVSDNESRLRFFGKF